MEQTLSRLTDELTLSGGLMVHGISLFDDKRTGISNFDERREKARATIKEFSLTKELLGKRSYRDWFVLVYAEEL